MDRSAKTNKANATPNAILSCFTMYVVIIALMATAARATEKGGSVYPTGVETVMPGMTPPPGATMFAEFDTTYQANSLVGAKGQSLVPGFNLSVYAVAPKVVHNWGVRFLGGTLVSAGALPILDVRLSLPSEKGHKTGLGNAEIGVAYLSYNRGAWHWWYGLDVDTPGLSYNKNDLVNIGQHYFSTVPVGAFTYLPNHGRTEMSSRLQYLVNYTNWATNYRSGNEFTWEYAAMQNVTKRLAIGANGYLYQQTTDDRQNGVTFGDGNRGRDLALGPQIRCHVAHVVLILKYQKDTLVQNRTHGNAFWFEVGVPIGHPHTPHPTAGLNPKEGRASL
jgi:hypothetical protein